MIAIGAHVRAPSSRYSAGLVVVEDGKLVDETVYAAPNRDRARSLHELYGRAKDTIAHHRPDAVALWTHEAHMGRYSPALGVSREAEGVILAAAGLCGHSVDVLAAATIGPKIGFTASRKHPEIRAHACEVLDVEPEHEETAYAAAAALAALHEAGWSAS